MAEKFNGGVADLISTQCSFSTTSDNTLHLRGAHSVLTICACRSSSDMNTWLARWVDDGFIFELSTLSSLSSSLSRLVNVSLSLAWSFSSASSSSESYTHLSCQLWYHHHLNAMQILAMSHRTSHKYQPQITYQSISQSINTGLYSTIRYLVAITVHDAHGCA